MHSVLRQLNACHRAFMPCLRGFCATSAVHTRCRSATAASPPPATLHGATAASWLQQGSCGTLLSTPVWQSAQWHATQQQPGQQQEQPQETQPRSSAPGDQQQQQQEASSEGKQQGSQQQQQQEQQQQQQEEEGPLEGPNGLLAEWRVESSLWWSRGFGLIVKSSLDFPQFVTWAELYQPKPPSLLRRLFVPEGGSILTHPLSGVYRQHSLVAAFLLAHAHADWDQDDFKEGVRQALEYSTQLYAAADWPTLKPLVSGSLLQSMRHARELQTAAMEEADATVTDIELVIDPDSVRLVSASSITREQLGALDESRASDALPLVPVGADDEESATVDAAASAASSAAHSAAASPVAEGAADLAAWDVAHVYAEGVLHTQVQQGDGPGRRVKLPKKGHYLLCRGPVHIDRVLSADAAATTPWFLLSWL